MREMGFQGKGTTPCNDEEKNTGILCTWYSRELDTTYSEQEKRIMRNIRKVNRSQITQNLQGWDKANVIKRVCFWENIVSRIFSKNAIGSIQTH